MRRASVSKIALACGIALAAAPCQTVPVDRPCGVITDSLRDVRGASATETRRIDVHFERGVAAGCWGRG